MKKLPLKMISAFSITMIMSFIPQWANAQKGNGKKPPQYCNCFVRPIPYQCGQICGFLAGTPPAIDDLSLPANHSNTISFELTEAQNVSLKIYDINGRLIKTLADSRLLKGEYQVEWNRKDEVGNTVNDGIYTLQLHAGNQLSTKKLTVINL